jgi:hypothetical protein
MRIAGRVLSLLVLLACLLPVLGQDEKKEPDKPEPEKKKEKEPAEEKLVYGHKFGPVKLVRAEGAEFAIDVPVPDAKKIYDLNIWNVQQMANISRQQNPQQRAVDLARHKMEYVRRQLNDTTSLKTVEVRAAENMKVRTNYPPVQFDDQGNLKRWTNKELIALRGKSKWPGTYPGEVDILKVGQVVEVYLAKPPAPPKGSGPKRKADLEAELPEGVKPEAVLIVVLQEVIPK